MDITYEIGIYNIDAEHAVWLFASIQSEDDNTWYAVIYDWLPGEDYSFYDTTPDFDTENELREYITATYTNNTKR